MPPEYRVIDWEFDWVSFGCDLTQAMTERRETSVGLAPRIGVSPQRIRAVMLGNGSHELFMSNFLKLCNALDLDPRRYWTVG